MPINAQNLILPAGDAKIGDRDYFVNLNSSPLTVAAMNDLPVRTSNGAVVYLKDVGQVHDGYAVQTNIVRENGHRGALLTIIKTARPRRLTSSIRLRRCFPIFLAGLPAATGAETAVRPEPLRARGDQRRGPRSRHRGRSDRGMILLFLGSWRSTLIVCTSIPLSILTSCIILWALGYTLNVMTLGGMALAVGILVDDATVEIENVHRNMGMAKPLTRAILDGAQQIALPAFVSTLAICIVFVPVVLLTGPARFLFTPLALAVVFAMLMSYFLTRTLVPTMVHFMLRSEVEIYAHGEEGLEQAEGPIWKMHHAFNRKFEKMRGSYRTALGWCLHHRVRALAVYCVFVGISLGLIAIVGTDFFPYWMPDSFACMCARPKGRASRKPSAFSATLKKASARISSLAKWTKFWTVSAFPTASISRSATRHHRLVRWRHPRVPERGTSPPNRTDPARTAAGAAGGLPGRDVLFHRGQHDESDPQLRHPRAHRRADRRPQCGR